MDPRSRIDPVRLLDLAAAVFEAAGMSGPESRLTADTLVQADLWGHPSHGVMRLPWYVARLQSGVCDPRAAALPVVDAGAVGVFDGGHGMGQVLAAHAMRDAIRRARAHGIGAVALRNSNHFGTAMYFTLMAAQAGCVGFLCSNASPAMAPWGGRSKAVGTNPWSWAAPAGPRAPMVLDIANTGVARGKIYLARQKGLPIPQGWAVDAAGSPTTDPAAALDGLILPMAQHKGFAIAVMMDMLSGVLAGGAFGAAIRGPYQAERRSGVGHFVIALDIEAFQTSAEFGRRMEQYIDELKSVPLASGFDEIFYPGEIEARNEAKHRAEGLKIPVDTLADLESLLPGLAQAARFG